jgi:hypothetical protein
MELLPAALRESLPRSIARRERPIHSFTSNCLYCDSSCRQVRGGDRQVWKDRPG